MTAPGRETVTEALAGHRDDGCGDCICSEYVLDGTFAEHLSDALAPTIERLLTEARAEALREAAASFAQPGDPGWAEVTS